jgi:hypothetical protein
MWIFSVASISSVVKTIDLEIINLSKVHNQIMFFAAGHRSTLTQTVRS